MKQIYGALSPVNNKKVCYTWQELRAEILKFKPTTDEYGFAAEYDMEDYQLRFRQMKSVMLRVGLVEKINKKFPSWFSEVDIIDYVLDCRRYTKKLDLADELDDFSRKNYDLSKVGGCFFDVLFMGYLRPDYELIKRYDNINIDRLSKAAFEYLNMNGSRKTYRELARDNKVSNPVTKEANTPPLYFILRELSKDESKKIGANKISIVIDKRLSKSKLTQFIDRKWPQISKLLDNLPVDEVDESLPSTRDLRIVELRDSLDMSYKQIASRISNEFELDDPDAKINEDSIKTSYHRTHKQLSKLIPER